MGILQAVVFSTQPWSQFFQRDPEEQFMDLPKLWFREIRSSLGEDQKLSKYELLLNIPNKPQVNVGHSSWVDDKNIMRVQISRNLYGASNHIIILTKNSFRKKISICQKCLSAIFSLLQKNSYLGERKKLQKMKVIFLDSTC